MPQPENATGIDPAACSWGPSRRPEIVTVTGRVTPRIGRGGALAGRRLDQTLTCYWPARRYRHSWLAWG